LEADARDATEEVLDGVAHGVEGIVGAARVRRDSALSQEDRKAAEEENAPVVSSVTGFWLSVRSIPANTTCLAPT
jgi:hypothetical protein